MSRSATVVAAYLMKSKGLDAATAVKFVKHKRPQIHPNYGFITQLMTFAACRYDPCPTNDTYRAWKKRQRLCMTVYLNYLTDTTAVIRNKLLLSSDFPEDSLQAESLIQDLGVTHMISFSPSKIPPTIPTSTSLTKYRHIPLSEKNKEDLLVALPEACRFIHQAIDNDGMVLIHSLSECRAVTVACASLMEMKNLSAEAAFGILQDALPLFNPTRNFYRHLELFAACGYNPTRGHFLVRDWIRSQGPYSTSSSSSSAASSPGPLTPISSVSSSRTSSSSSHAGVGPFMTKGHTSLGKAHDCHNDSLAARAMELLSDSDDETAFDLGSFGQALVAIQESRARER
jgi:dual specificity phosphatase 12